MQKDKKASQYFYMLGQIDTELSINDHTKFLRCFFAPLVEIHSSATTNHPAFLAIEKNGSIAFSKHSEQPQPINYSIYGYDPTINRTYSKLGYTGERRVPFTSFYLLGNYRTYNPALLRFHSTDRSSPFGAGGINAYAYCSNDPANHTDPTGQAPIRNIRKHRVRPYPVARVNAARAARSRRLDQVFEDAFEIIYKHDIQPPAPIRPISPPYFTHYPILTRYLRKETALSRLHEPQSHQLITFNSNVPTPPPLPVKPRESSGSPPTERDRLRTGNNDTQHATSTGYPNQ